MGLCDWTFWATLGEVVEVLIECLLFGPWWVWAVWLRQTWRTTEKIKWFSHGKLKKKVQVSKGVKVHWVPYMA